MATPIMKSLKASDDLSFKQMAVAIAIAMLQTTEKMMIQRFKSFFDAKRAASSMASTLLGSGKVCRQKRTVNNTEPIAAMMVIRSNFRISLGSRPRIDARKPPPTPNDMAMQMVTKLRNDLALLRSVFGPVVGLVGSISNEQLRCENRSANSQHINYLFNQLV